MFDPTKTKRFDSYEIRQVIERNNPVAGEEIQTFCEPLEPGVSIEEARQDEFYVRDFWTLYGHNPDGGVEDIADVSSEDDALELLYKLTGIVAQPGDMYIGATPSEYRIEEAIFDLSYAAGFDKLAERYSDSRSLFNDIQAWAREFEAEWNKLAESEQDDYIGKIDAFYEEKANGKD